MPLLFVVTFAFYFKTLIWCVQKQRKSLYYVIDLKMFWHNVLMIKKV